MHFCGLIFVSYKQIIAHPITVLPFAFVSDNVSWRCFLPSTHGALPLVKAVEYSVACIYYN